MHHLRNDSIGRPTAYFVEEIIKHPQYNSTNKRNDIGLIRLSENVVYNESVQPICLSFTRGLENVNEETSYEFGGWGSNGTGRV